MIGESVSKNTLVYGQLFGPLLPTLYGDLGLSFFQLLSLNSDAAGPFDPPSRGRSRATQELRAIDHAAIDII
jgi:hypothetical protein